MGWVKGQSGNPRGRPRTGLALATYVRSKAGDDGRCYVDALHTIATDLELPAPVRLQAISLLLDRGWGRASQTHELVGDPDRPVPVVFGGRYLPDGTLDGEPSDG